MEQYDCKRELGEISDQWHRLTLPLEVFGKIEQDLSDIRIFGLTPNNDTIESPYIIHVAREKISRKEVSFNTLNTSKSNLGYFFTFELPGTETINEIELNFAQQNFDWSVRLEGSQNQDEWYTVVDDCRILSIHNEMANFQFAKLSFPDSKYRFFRLMVTSDVEPKLTFARIAMHDETPGCFQDFDVKSMIVKENKELKQTEIEVELKIPAPVSRLALNMSDSFDYYRPVEIKYCVDSVQTEVGWKYSYHTLQSGILNSLVENVFKFESTILSKLKIIIHNQDNQPLTLEDVGLSGYVHELTARFNEPATYFLTYGNKMALRSHYDIIQFGDRIPNDIKLLSIGVEQMIEKVPIEVKEPLFQNKMWLWAVMIVVILLLGWFSLKMLRNS
ncbi:MAG: hypothetical protein ACJAV7_002258 [Flavobacteriales bacterium]|jgi:hypothetical protein